MLIISSKLLLNIELVDRLHRESDEASHNSTGKSGIEAFLTLELKKCLMKASLLVYYNVFKSNEPKIKSSKKYEESS